MATLHEVLSQHSEVLSCYRRILATSEGADVPTDNIITMVTYLLGLKDNSQDIWNLVRTCNRACVGQGNFVVYMFFCS